MLFKRPKLREGGEKASPRDKTSPLTIYGIALAGFKDKKRCTAIQSALENWTKKIDVRNALCIPVYRFKSIATCISFHLSDLKHTYQHC